MSFNIGDFVIHKGSGNKGKIITKYQKEVYGVIFPQNPEFTLGRCRIFTGDELIKYEKQQQLPFP